MTRLCLTLTGKTLEENLSLLNDLKPDLAELRIDLLETIEAEEIALFPAQTGVPLILTCRKEEDGGLWKGSGREREDLLLHCMDGAFAYIDLEEDEYSKKLVEKALNTGCLVIRSIHDFQAVPDDLPSRLEAMSSRGDFVKAAVMPKGIKDLIRIFRIGMEWETDNLILLGMGDFGVPSRILACRAGSYLTFCSAGGTRSGAPGHMTLDTLRDLYRVGEIDRDTELYGIIGNPVLHTKSPLIHNQGLRKIGRNGVYVPFTVDDPEDFFQLAELLGLKGFSVTVPHKQGVIPFLDHCSEGVEKVGACNTVVRESGGWAGYNTDVHGFIAPLKQELGDLEGLKAAVLGAGGAARAVVYALVKEKCRTRVFNRTSSKAAALAEHMGCESGSLEDFAALEPGHFDLIVQTTSSGMEGASGPDNPVPAYSFRGDEVLYDIIYTPPVTGLMKKAADAGCRVLGGWPMLVEQAREQFRLFTREELPEN